MIEARKFSCDDQGYVDLRLRRSLDQGQTWTPSQLVHGNSTATHWTTVGDANMVEDRATGIVWLFHTRNNTKLFLSSSLDQGVSWSTPLEVTRTLKLGYPRYTGWIGTGHAGGIQLSTGPYQGRLLVPTYTNQSYMIYSDDAGLTWHKGTGTIGGENQISETGTLTDTGMPILIVSIRNSPRWPNWVPLTHGHRLLALSHDGGVTWGHTWHAKDLPEPIKGCDGSIVYHRGTGKLYFSHPDPVLGLFRTRMTVWSSADVGQSWQVHRTVWKEAAGYSALTVMGNASNSALGLLFDRNNHTMVVFEAQSVSWTVLDA
jgi:sialidase-1